MGTHSAKLSDQEAWRLDRLGSARRGENPTVIARLRSGFVAMADTQFLPGYCMLIADADEVDHLTDLPRPDRQQFLTDLGLLGEALMAACPACDPAFARLNYEILGNQWRHLHGHVFPRYTWEPVELRDNPVWRYPESRWSESAHALGADHDRLVEAITRELSRVLAEAY